MGSFNTACFATRQTITPGDEVVLIPISQNTSGKPINIFQPDGKKLQVFGCFDTTCYPTAFWDYRKDFATAQSICQSGTKNSQFGTVWMNYILVGSKRVKSELVPDLIEQGWFLGKTLKTCKVLLTKEQIIGNL